MENTEGLEFMELTDVLKVEKAKETSNILIEEDGEIKKVPTGEISNGEVKWITLLFRSSAYMIWDCFFDGSNFDGVTTDCEIIDGKVDYSNLKDKDGNAPVPISCVEICDLWNKGKNIKVKALYFNRSEVTDEQLKTAKKESYIGQVLGTSYYLSPENKTAVYTVYGALMHPFASSMQDAFFGNNEYVPLEEGNDI